MSNQKHTKKDGKVITSQLASIVLTKLTISCVVIIGAVATATTLGVL